MFTKNSETTLFTAYRMQQPRQST